MNDVSMVHHRRSIRLKGYDYTSPGVYFVTIVAHDAEAVFGEIVDNTMVLSQQEETHSWIGNE